VRHVGEQIFWIANFAAMTAFIVLSGAGMAYILGWMP
jgi:hypothetical protein